MIIPSELSALVVDDNDYARELAAAALKKLGILSVFSVKDAASGLQVLQRNDISFVVLDWYMPEINGAGFVRLIRGGAAGCTTDLPIIIATAYATRENTGRIRDLGLHEILVKPFDIKQLRMAVSLALSRARKSESAPHDKNSQDKSLQDEAPQGEVRDRVLL